MRSARSLPSQSSWAMAKRDLSSGKGGRLPGGGGEGGGGGGGGGGGESK